MKRAVRLLFGLVALGLVLCALILAAGWWGGPLDDIVLTLDDEVYTLADLGRGTPSVPAAVGVVSAGLLLLIVLPVAVLLPLLVVGMAMAAVALALALVAAFFLWPLFLLAWWLVRPSRRRRREATMAR